MNSRPVSIINDEGLQEVIKIASGNMSYKLPTRHSIDSRIMNLYSNSKATVEEFLNNTLHVALTLDYWSSNANESFLEGMTHFIDKSWQLHSFSLTVRHIIKIGIIQKNALIVYIFSVAEEGKINKKITTLGTEKAHNMTAVVTLLPFEYLPCMALTLQLSVNNAVIESGFEIVLTKLRKIVGQFKHSPANNEELRKVQDEMNMRKMKLIQDGPTRWHSTLQMI